MSFIYLKIKISFYFYILLLKTCIEYAKFFYPVLFFQHISLIIGKNLFYRSRFMDASMHTILFSCVSLPWLSVAHWLFLKSSDSEVMLHNDMHFIADRVICQIFRSLVSIFFGNHLKLPAFELGNDDYVGGKNQMM